MSSEEDPIEYKIATDFIVSPDDDIVVSLPSGSIYMNSITEENRIPTMADVANGGGGGADTGDITFDGVKIIGAGDASGDGNGYGTMELVPDADLYDNDQYLIIDPTAPNHIHIRAGGTQDDSDAELFLGGENTYVRIVDSYGLARMQASYEYNNTYYTGDWESAVVTGDEFNRYIEVVNPGQDILDLLDSSQWQNSNQTFVQIDGGEKLDIYGIGISEGTLTINLSFEGPVLEPTSIDSLGFYWINSSRIEIDMNDDEELSIRGNGIDVRIESSDDIYVNADDFLGLRADNNIVIESYSGGEYLNDDENPLNQIATLGDIGVDTEFEVVGGALGTQPTFDGDPLFNGSYVKTGPMVHFRFDVDFDNITSFGTDQYYLDLPVTPKYNYEFTAGCLHDISTGRDYTITGHVFAGNTRMTLKAPTVTGQTSYTAPFTSTYPITLDVADNFHVSGDYICEVVD
jgi:hypothetical protein